MILLKRTKNDLVFVTKDHGVQLCYGPEPYLNFILGPFADEPRGENVVACNADGWCKLTVGEIHVLAEWLLEAADWMEQESRTARWRSPAMRIDAAKPRQWRLYCSGKQEKQNDRR